MNFFKSTKEKSLKWLMNLNKELEQKLFQGLNLSFHKKKSKFDKIFYFSLKKLNVLIFKI